MPWLRSGGAWGENKAPPPKKKKSGFHIRKLQTLERNYKCDVMAASLPAAGSKQLPCRLQKYLVLSFVFAVATVRLTILSVLGVVSGFWSAREAENRTWRKVASGGVGGRRGFSHLNPSQQQNFNINSVSNSTTGSKSDIIASSFISQRPITGNAEEQR